MSIYDLIETPNPDDPLVSSIVSFLPLEIYMWNWELTRQADQYRQDRPAFNKKAAEYTRQVSLIQSQKAIGLANS